MKKGKIHPTGSLLNHLLLALLGLFCLLPYIGKAQESGYNPFWENIPKPQSYDQEYTIQTGSVNITQPGSYHIIGTGVETSYSISVNLPNTTDVAYIVLENMNHVSNGEYGMFLAKGTVALELHGDNRMISNRADRYTSDGEGLHVSNPAILIITKESDGSSLTVQGGRNNAALGEHWGNRPGVIVINGGNLHIKADSEGGSAIGNSWDPKNGTGHSIYLNGGYIEMIGGSKGKSISCVEKLYITGGTIKAPQGIEGTQVYISGGSVEASEIIPAPIDMEGNSLTQRTIPLAPYTSVTEWEGVANYNLNDLYANKEGKLFLWLPQATTTPAITKTFIPPTIRLDNQLWEWFNKTYSIIDSRQTVVTPKQVNFKEVYYLDPGRYTFKETSTSAQLEFEVDNIATSFIDYYTIGFNENGGSWIYPANEVFLSGQKIEKIKIPETSMQYHYIKSWNTNQQGTGTTWDFDRHTVNSTTTLYAQWAPNPIIQDNSFSTSIPATENKEIEIDLSELIDITDNSGSKTFSLLSGAPDWVTINGEMLNCKFNQVQGTQHASVLIEAENGAERTVVLSFVGKPVNPPLPFYSWYKVILPAVAGITYVRNDKEFDSLEQDVLEGSTFSFFLKAVNGVGYTVTTSRGEELKPRPSDGKYIIYNVEEDLTVYVSSVPLGLENTGGNGTGTDGVCLYMMNGGLCITVNTPQPVTIVTLGGVLVKQFTAPAGESRLYLPAGSYVVQVGRKKQIIVI